MAWIYYQRNAEVVLNDQRVGMLVTFDPTDTSQTNLLQFVLAEFYLNGTFISYYNLTDQLVLCPHSYIIGVSYKKFGTNVDVSCELDLSVYITASETTFYELYLLDTSNNKTLIDVPILIKNFVDSDGSMPNQSNDESR